MSSAKAGIFRGKNVRTQALWQNEERKGLNGIASIFVLVHSSPTMVRNGVCRYKLDKAVVWTLMDAVERITPSTLDELASSGRQLDSVTSGSQLTPDVH
jgi:hypothetical protein